MSLDPSEPFSISFMEDESYILKQMWLVDSTTITSLHLSIWSFLWNCGEIPRHRTIYLHPLQQRRSSRRPMTVLQDDVH